MFKKKNFFLIVIFILTLVFGALAVITAVKIYQLGKQPIAPNAPSSKPKAEGVCSLTFTVSVVTPTNTPTPSPAKCNEICNQAVNPPIIRNCETGLTCWSSPSAAPGSASRCRNAQCPTQIDCTCDITVTPTGTPLPTATTTPTSSPTSSPTPTPTGPTSTPVYKSCFISCDNDTQCESNLTCVEFSGTKRCLNPTCPQETDCGCNRCWQFCTNDWECVDGLNCLSVSGQKRCVNRNCSSTETCTCQPTPTTLAGGATATPRPTSPPSTPTQIAQVPSQPVTGAKTATAFGILSGFLLLSLGLALIF